MDIQDIKKRYEEAYIEDFGDFEIVHIDKKELDWLIEQAEKVEKLHNENRRYKEVQRDLVDEQFELRDEIKELKEIDEELRNRLLDYYEENKKLKSDIKDMLTGYED